MDGTTDTGAVTPPLDATKKILAQAQGDGTTPGADKPADAAPDAPKPMVDLASPDGANLPKGKDAPVTNLNGATISGDKIVFTPPAPGAPDTTGGDIKPAVATADAKPGDVKPPVVVTGDLKPGDVKPPAVATGDLKPGDVKPPAVATGDAKPGDDPKLKGTVNADTVFDKTYNKVDKPADDADKVKLPPEVEKDIAEKMAAFRKTVDQDNFTITIGEKEGPNPAIVRQRQEVHTKEKAGKEVTPQDKAITQLSDKELRDEAVRMRDRDFKVFKDHNGKPRNWYIEGEKSPRWTEAEIKEKMTTQEQTLRQGAEKAIKETEAKAREVEAEKARLTATAIEKNVPNESMIKDAATKAHVEGDPKDIRDKMVAQVVKEVADGTLTPADLAKPYPRVGAALVGTGALTSGELKDALDEQKTRKTTAIGKAVAEGKTEEEAKRQTQADPSLRFGAVLDDIYKDNKEKRDQVGRGSNFYDELKKIVETDAAKKKDEALTDPFGGTFNEVPKTETKVVVPGDKPPTGPSEGLPSASDKPTAADGDKPIVVGDKPVVADGDKPVVADGDKPVVADGDKPVVVDGDKPVVADGDKPVVADGDKPVVADGDKPVVADGDKPVVADGDKPVVADGDKPVVADGDKPVVVEDKSVVKPPSGPSELLPAVSENPVVTGDKPPLAPVEELPPVPATVDKPAKLDPELDEDEQADGKPPINQTKPTVRR